MAPGNQLWWAIRWLVVLVFFLRVDHFDETYHRMVEKGIQFVTEPKVEPYGTVAVFVDISGNRWDLLGR